MEKKKEKKKKKERGEIDGQLREGIYLLQNHDLCIELGPKKKKKKLKESYYKIIKVQRFLVYFTQK